MHMHRLEKIWLVFGVAMLAVFLIVLGIMSFGRGIAPPNEHIHHVDAATVTDSAPFNEPGLKEIGPNEYEAIMVAYAFGYDPVPMEVPAGATVHFTITSTDVIHGFEIPGTNVNVMVMPGEVSHVTHTFNKPGEYLILCNEYCGIGHEVMQTTIKVI
ncbi:MAG: cytochrome c oxidase subunit II [Candidatus Cohnella colombiensis]|uniref:Cytochrome aa3 subunit 2 n=1 Tax=Candidatus Cohnella colombiensis TaxID=3121368 RepID=A0AA95EXT5_9BACL|nr:MAG: cytochrome c oxidase subunit II [Cohnella sp.]